MHDSAVDQGEKDFKLGVPDKGSKNEFDTEKVRSRILELKVMFDDAVDLRKQRQFLVRKEEALKNTYDRDSEQKAENDLDLVR